MNTYLIISDTIYFINKTLDSLKNGIANVITFNMEENNLDEVLEEASYFSMFDDKKCIIVRNAKFFSLNKKDETQKSKEDCEKLCKYLDSENKNTKLIFILNGKADTRKKVYHMLNEKNNVIISPSMTKTDMKNELNKIVISHGFKCQDKVLWYIINNSLGNFDLAVNELNKIFIYYEKPQEIKEEDVIHLVSKTISENNFRLVDSIISRDLDNSLKYLEEAKILKIEPTVIIALIYREYKLMLSTLLYEENKYNRKEILSNLKLADWQLDKVKGNLRLYNKDEIKAEIVCLSELDYQCKSGLISKDEILLNYIMNLCV